MRNWIFFVLILLITNISALCNETQIDINAASLEDMMKIVNLGGQGVVAQRVIDNRTFNSLDDLIRVKGIGNVTLTEIKIQGLACVSNEDVKTTSEENESSELTDNELFIDENENSSESKNTGNVVKSTDVVTVENVNDIDEINSPPNTINLTPKDIKSDKSFLKTSKNNVAFYWLGIFGIFLAFLFALKHYGMRKNEF